MATLPSLPIVGHVEVRVDAGMAQEIQRLARRLRRDEPALAATEAFGDRVGIGVEHVPSLVVGPKDVVDT